MIIERVGQIIEALGISQTDFCKKAKLNPVSLSTTKTRGAEMREASIVAIIKAYPEISMRWLLLGEGDMLLPEQPAASVQNMTVVNGNGNTQIYSPAECAERLREKDMEISRLRGQVEALHAVINNNKV